MLRPILLALTSLWGEPPPDAPVHLQWSAPEGCPPVEYVRARTEALLGRGLDDPRHPQVDARVIVERRAGRWSAALELATGDGRRARTLRAASCEALADAAALLLAVTIDPTARLAGLAGAVAAAPTDRAPVDVPTDVPVAERPAVVQELARPRPSPPAGARPDRRPHALVGLAFALQGGGAPGLALGAAGAVGLGWRRARLLLLGSYAAPASPRAIAPGARLHTTQGWAALAGCAVFARGRFAAPICGGWFAGSIRGVATGLARAGPLRLPWTGLVVGVGLRVALHRNVAATFDALALVPVVRPSFVVEQLGVVHQAAAVAASGQLGLELRFP